MILFNESEKNMRITQAKNKRAESGNMKRITLNKRYRKLGGRCVELPANF